MPLAFSSKSSKTLWSTIDKREVVSSLKALATETLLELLRTSLEQKNLWPADVFYILDQENQGYLLPVTWMRSLVGIHDYELFLNRFSPSSSRTRKVCL